MRSIRTNKNQFNRRGALELLGAFGASLAVGCGERDNAASGAVGMSSSGVGPSLVDPMGVGLDSLSCVLTPALDQGPFFVDENLERSDLISGETEPGLTSGAPLILEFGVYAVAGESCTPLTGAHVDIWHADVNGLYSDTAAGFIQPTDTRGKTFLRGYQVVGADGTVTFQTIYPGWYATRTIHVHAKIRSFAPSGDATLEATTQVFFDDAVTDALFEGSAYLARGPRSIPKNTNDEIFNGTGVGRSIDNLGPAAGQARPGEAALAKLSRTTLAGKPALLARMKIGIQLE